MDTIMRKFKTLREIISGTGRNNMKRTVAGFAIALTAFCLSTLSCYAVEGKVTAETAKIRAQTSTDSEVVGSTQRGKTIDILEAVKDSSGSVWYKVSVTGGGYGYIRSDLVETSATIEPTSQTSTSQAGTSAPAETTPTSIGEQSATITSNKNANIRSGASTQHSTVATLPNGTAVTLIGEANDNSGNKWYQIRCTYNDKEVEGYVRSDLITLGGTGGEAAPAEGTEGENPEGTEGENPEGTEGENPEGAEGTEGTEPSQPAPEEHNDYEIVYAQNDTGEYEYYLYNNMDGTRQKLNELLSAISFANESNQKLQDQIDKGKIIIIILAVVIVILFIVMTILLFKIRSLYYGDYDEDEEEEEEEEEEEPEPEPVKRKRRRRIEEEDEEEEEQQPPVKKKRPRPQEGEERPARSQERTAQPKPKGSERELRALENREPAKKQPARKPQNFLVDDDEFEFEFLNMDDKDL